MLLPAYVTGSELTIVTSLFMFIRLKSTGLIFSVVIVSISTVTFFIFKLALEGASSLTDASQDFAKPPNLDGSIKFTKFDLQFLRSCRPLILTVGSTFKISKDTFPTISQNVILNGAINLLLTF